MGGLPVIRRLRRRPLIVAIGGAVALALGLVAATASPSSSVVASTRVALDTPSSQVIEASPFGADSLPWRASLLAHLTAREASVKRIAREAGIEPARLAVSDPALGVPKAPASLPNAAAEAAIAAGQAPYLVTVYLADPLLPIISIDAQAPDHEQARRLAAAMAGELKAQAPSPDEVPDVPPSVAASQAAATVPKSLQGFVVEAIEPIRAKELEAGRGPVKALALSVVVFGLWCACVALGPTIIRSARARVGVQPA
jgi:hypothetical protein